MLGMRAVLAGAGAMKAVAENRPYRGHPSEPAEGQGSEQTIADSADEADAQGTRGSKSILGVLVG